MLLSTKTTKLHELVGQVQFVVFEKFTSAYYTKFQGKLLSLVDNAQEKTSQKDKIDKIWKHAHAIYNLYSLELHENAFVNQPIRGA